MNNKPAINFKKNINICYNYICYNDMIVHFSLSISVQFFSDVRVNLKIYSKLYKHFCYLDFIFKLKNLICIFINLLYTIRQFLFSDTKI